MTRTSLLLSGDRIDVGVLGDTNCLSSPGSYPPYPTTEQTHTLKPQHSCLHCLGCQCHKCHVTSLPWASSGFLSPFKDTPYTLSCETQGQFLCSRPGRRAL